MIYDLSPEISPTLGVWPGDTPPTREIVADMKAGDTITLSTLRATVHLGAHADAPSHYGKDAASIETRPLDLYVGPCQVIRVHVSKPSRVSLADVDAALSGGGAIVAERVLLCTNTFPDPTNFTTDFAALDPDLVDALHVRGVRLIGIDTPSVDLFDSKDLPAHQRFLANDMAILEGLQLTHVPPATYELIALPLKLTGFDASPVRAILRAISPS